MIASARSSSIPRAPKAGGARYRLAVASRAIAAIIGGYALAAGTSVALALSLKGGTTREDAVMLATMPSFLVWAGAVIWVFAARTAGRAWLGIVGPGVLVALAIWLFRSGGNAS
jgi:hypothetical protein